MFNQSLTKYLKKIYLYFAYVQQCSASKAGPGKRSVGGKGGKSCALSLSLSLLLLFQFWWSCAECEAIKTPQLANVLPSLHIVLTTSNTVETCDGIGNWHAAACLDNRTDVQCLHRWQKVLNPNLVKGYWTAEVLLHAFSSLLLPRPDSLSVHTQVRNLLDWGIMQRDTRERERERETHTHTHTQWANLSRGPLIHKIRRSSSHYVCIPSRKTSALRSWWVCSGRNDGRP